MCSNDWSTDMCSSDLSGASVALTPFIFIGPIFMPGISVIVRSIPENCATSASEKTSWIFVGAATTVSAAGVALLRDRKSTRRTPVTNAHLVCRLLLETKNYTQQTITTTQHNFT